MVVKPPPAAALVVPQPEVLLQILVVALDAPALMNGADQFVDRGVFGQRGQGVLGRLWLMGRPLDEQPLQGAQARLAGVAAGVANPQRREAAAE